jgi:hypothetical protein
MKKFEIKAQDGSKFGELDIQEEMPCKEIYKGVAQLLGVPQSEVAVYHNSKRVPNDGTKARDAINFEGESVLIAVPKDGTGWL